ncbi:MAG: 50S ribosomal protein L44e [Acidilobaceae archaeon]|nr:50S ribosomal protein L44e [Acidilobaceae archaeon]
MKFPKKIRTYCPRCKAHSEHSVSIYKHGQRRTLAEGQRRYLRKQEGYGSKRKPEQKRLAKVNKRITLKISCSQCGYKRHILNLRLKKVELVEVGK